jgi:hypothetical protein
MVNNNSVQIVCETLAKLNFACHQSAVAFLRELTLVNNDIENPLVDLKINLTSEPAAIKEKSWRVERVDAGGTLTLKDRDVTLDGGLLLDLADSMRCTVTICVESGGSLLVEETKSIELLAYNEWGGAGYMPDLLAAFSTPNDPSVDKVLHSASTILGKAGKSDAIDGYKAGSRERVWEIASAIYTAICNMDIKYSVPPASFENDGQKIRLPGQIIENRVGTCLDLTMLYVSATEQAGLNPVIALPKGHALAGVWLQPEELASIVIDDAETLRKRIQLKELVLIETTFVTQAPAPPFSKAILAGESEIAPGKDVDFSAAIDVRRARAHRITPLGLKQGDSGVAINEGEAQHVELPLEEAPALPSFDDGLQDDFPSATPPDRLERWQRKLLDLTARNSLLNHKSSKTTLRLICPEPGLLEDKLASGKPIRIRPVPQPSAQEQDEELHWQRTGEVITAEYAKEALETGEILVDLPEKELSKRAVEIYRKAQTALEEGGANTLYLAIGFLLWKRSDNESRRFRAPLILLPISLQRKSVRSGIKMVAHEDEPRFNTTLLEMLRKDFEIDVQGYDSDLPTDEHGIDVNGIWTVIRQQVKDAPGFEVTEDVALGHFSFAKYLMWKDLVDRTDALKKNSVVRHLIDTPSDPYPSDVSFVDARDLDREYKPSELLTPLPADSSQLAVIATVDRGKDFIINGPPGTGKSQTIANLIAHTIGTEKTILFVSEKTAALEVVYRRLQEVGLSKFCLQLHSNKARKTDVLAQLGEAWGVDPISGVDSWDKTSEDLLKLRDQLNNVVDRLHLQRSNGLTAYHAIGKKIKDENIASTVAFSWPRAEQHNVEHLAEMREAVEKLQIQATEIDNFSETPFDLIVESDWSPKWQAQVVERAGRLSTAASNAQRAMEGILRVIDVELPDHTLSRLDSLAKLTKMLLESHENPIDFALDSTGRQRIEALGQAEQTLQEYASKQTKLSCFYDQYSWRQLDGQDIETRSAEIDASWWPWSVVLTYRLVKDMKSGGAKGNPDPGCDAPILKRLRELGESLDAVNELLEDIPAWKGHDTDPDVAQNLKKRGENGRNTIGALFDGTSDLIQGREKIRLVISDGNDLLATDASIGKAAKEFFSAFSQFKEACRAFEDIAGRSIREQFVDSELDLGVVRDTAERIVSHEDELAAWCAWIRRRTEAIDLNLGSLVNSVEQGLTPIGEICDTFEAAYCTWFSGAIIDEDDVLRLFSKAEHVAAIDKFADLDEKFRQLTSAYIRAKITGKLPAEDEVERKSTWGVLRRELQKKRRHMSVRRLIDEIPDVIRMVSPCLMMSPISVAQYLPTHNELFDVVIFDEASQIPVWDAVGSIARGRQVIVAGDPKQMPPTNFFNRSDDDPDGEIDIEGDLESILDEMLGAGIPERTLNLHYRSRRESLIAFSNNRYYDNELITFPAPITPDNGVRLVSSDGFYARGGARTNIEEARAIVADVIRRLKEEDPHKPEKSIGVVTFNAEQQSLIQDLLDHERNKDTNIEWAFSSENLREPVFVKNLETVQGDERDVILFSVTYGPDRSGHVTMNFGPLNKDGGERRLNVALTRSRLEMCVFSTLTPDKIDLSRTQAQGVIDLKHFLEFAQRGPSALGAAVYGSIGDYESPFEIAVARALKQRGWNVHPQIGASAYRIDLGIVHPDKPGEFLAGIECDGAMYHSSACARERDTIRQTVLEGLGWTLFRVWSTDWWTNKQKALDTLHSDLMEHLDKEKSKDNTGEETNRADSSPANTGPCIKEAVFESTNGDTPEDPGASTAESKSSGYVKPQAGDTLNSEQQPEETGDVKPVDTKNIQEDAPTDVIQRNYVETNLQLCGREAEPGNFYESSYRDRLITMTNFVIDSEGPIHEKILVDRVARYHGFTRSGQKISELVINIAKRQRASTKEDVGSFFWPKGVSPETLSFVRVADRMDEMRNVKYICKQEIKGIASVLSTGNDPKIWADKIGLQRLRQSARDRLTQVLDARL